MHAEEVNGANDTLSKSSSSNSAAGVCSVLSGKRRYNIKLWKTFTDCFNCLPVAAIVDERSSVAMAGSLLTCSPWSRFVA